MTPLDRKLLPRILATINKYGVTATFSVSGATQFDELTGEVNPTQPDTFTAKVTPPADYARNYDGATEPGDAYVFLAASGLGFDPEIGMRVEIAGKTWGVVSVDKFVSGDSIAAFKLQLRD